MEQPDVLYSLTVTINASLASRTRRQGGEKRGWLIPSRRRELGGSEIGLGHRGGGSMVVASYEPSDLAALRRGVMERYTEALVLAESVPALPLSAKVTASRLTGAAPRRGIGGPVC